jgi:AraC-like DNA-binding protein
MSHAIPAIIMMLFVLPIIISSEKFYERKEELRQVSYYFIKFQILVYNLYTLNLIYRYRKDIKSLTSVSEKQKLNWLFFIIYGYAITSLAGSVVYSIPGFSDPGWGYIVFWIFINVFFFKAILHPDQFLGVEERKLLPVKLDSDKSLKCFKKIEEIIDSKQLFLDPDLSLHNVAEATNLSDRIISQTIKQQVAFNFADYINRKRINYAKEVLGNTTKSEKNVLEILYEAGFNSKSVFNTQFKKHTGLSPTTFREMNQR